MTPERWVQVRDLLHSAMELEPSRRPAYLDHHCSSDPSLRKDVDSFLAAEHELSSGLLELPAVAHLVRERNTSLPVSCTAGTKLGPYEIQSLLGAGGMGEVYRAHDPRLVRDVAIKVLPRAFVDYPDRLRRFEQEARAAAALNHPNILAIYDIGTTDQTIPYVVSELLDGETLRECLRRGALPIQKSLDLALQITSGLAAAHEKGIVHRDLKPENLFVTKDGRIKILDFGLAKLMEPLSLEQSDPTLADKAERGAVMGTVGYMAPEQVRAQSVDYRTDIFAFGAVMFEMFTGKRAFQRVTSADTLSAILNEKPSFSQPSGNTTPALQRVISRCLEKNPERRFHSAAELALAIESLPESSVPRTSVLARNLHVRPWMMWGALLVIAVVLSTWRFARSSDKIAIHSIAVLPFANAGNDPDMDYLGEGLAEEVTNSLSRIPNLKVMARSTMSHYKSRQDNPQGVGRELHVDAVLTGHLTRHGDDLDVETELVNVGTGAQLWGERYRRNADDPSLLAAAITPDIASHLRPQLSEDERQKLARVGTRDAEAYRSYLKGRFHFEVWTAEDLNEAVESFEKAIAKDPSYAAAYAGLADVYAVQGYMGYVSGLEVMNKARSAAERALLLDSGIAESHTALANVDFNCSWNLARRSKRFKKLLL